MTAASSFLYDHPGPKARMRSRLYAVLFLVVLVLLGWAALSRLSDKGELDWVKWQPFTTGDVWQILGKGLLNTLKAAVLSVALALPLGIVLAVGRLSEHRTVRWVIGSIVEFFRAIPVVILMLFVNQAYVIYLKGVSSDTRVLAAVVTALVVYNAAVLAEIFRAGIRALPRGQSEAAVALGLRRGQQMRVILLPQALTAMLPAVISQLVVTLKDTALGGVLIGYSDLFRSISPLQSFYFNPVATYTVVAVIYICVNVILSTSARQLDAWNRKRRLGKSAPPALGPGGTPAVPLPGAAP